MNNSARVQRFENLDSRPLLHNIAGTHPMQDHIMPASNDLQEAAVKLREALRVIEVQLCDLKIRYHQAQLQQKKVCLAAKGLGWVWRSGVGTTIFSADEARSVPPLIACASSLGMPKRRSGRCITDS